MTRCFAIKSSDIGRCPKGSLLPRHFRDDGSCRCNDLEIAAEMKFCREKLTPGRNGGHKAWKAKDFTLTFVDDMDWTATYQTKSATVTGKGIGPREAVQALRGAVDKLYEEFFA